MVSVDVKHHVYLLEGGRERTACRWDIGEGEETGLYYKGKEGFAWLNLFNAELAPNSCWWGPTPTCEVGRGGEGDYT